MVQALDIPHRPELDWSNRARDEALEALGAEDPR
jgi:hypothetical protein